MRGIYYDQESHKFIEGPVQSEVVNNSLLEGIAEKVAYHADPTQGYELEGGTNDIDIDRSCHDTNERYD